MLFASIDHGKEGLKCVSLSLSKKSEKISAHFVLDKQGNASHMYPSVRRFYLQIHFSSGRADEACKFSLETKLFAHADRSKYSLRKRGRRSRGRTLIETGSSLMSWDVT